MTAKKKAKRGRPVGYRKANAATVRIALRITPDEAVKLERQPGETLTAKLRQLIQRL